MLRARRVGAVARRVWAARPTAASKRRARASFSSSSMRRALSRPRLFFFTTFRRDRNRSLVSSRETNCRFPNPPHTRRPTESASSRGGSHFRPASLSLSLSRLEREIWDLESAGGALESLARRLREIRLGSAPILTVQAVAEKRATDAEAERKSEKRELATLKVSGNEACFFLIKPPPRFRDGSVSHTLSHRRSLSARPRPRARRRPRATRRSGAQFQRTFNGLSNGNFKRNFQLNFLLNAGGEARAGDDRARAARRAQGSVF